MKPLKIEELGYLAGFIDAEMSVIIQRRKHTTRGHTYDGYSVYLDLSTTSEEILRWLCERLGGVIGRKTQIYGHKPAFWWRLNGRSSVALLEAVFPYVVIKKPHAILALQFPFGKRSKDAAELKAKLFNGMKRLNRRGSVNRLQRLSGETPNG